MLDLRFDGSSSIAVLEQSGLLSIEDFASVRESLDQHLSMKKELLGIVVVGNVSFDCASFVRLAWNLKLVGDYHHQLKYLAFVESSRCSDGAIACVFKNAKVRDFERDELESAITWMLSENEG